MKNLTINQRRICYSSLRTKEQERRKERRREGREVRRKQRKETKERFKENDSSINQQKEKDNN